MGCRPGVQPLPMAQALFRFYAELNELLPWQFRQRDRLHAFQAPASVKDRIEAQGIPHTEVDLILVNGAPAGFDRLLADGDRVSVYPYLAKGPSPLPLRPPHPRSRFLLDQHLARLAEADPAAVRERLPESTRGLYRRFWTCPSCARVFWEGAHVRRMRGWVEGWLSHPDVAGGT